MVYCWSLTVKRPTSFRTVFIHQIRGTDGFHESRLAGEVFLYWRSFVTCLWKVPETDATTSTTICYHSLKEFTVPDRRCSSHLRTSLSICRFAQMAAICVTNCHNLWRCKKNSQMSGWLLPQGCKAYKEFPAFPAACNYSRSDKVTWYRPRGQLLCRVCVGNRNPHLCLLLYCMKLHRLSAVLYTSHLNETNECYSLPPYTVAAGTGCVFHFLTWTPFNAFLHLVLRLPSLGKTET